MEDVVKEINDLGVFVNNLFQLKGEGKWRANLHDGKKGYEFSEGASPKDALRSCLEKARKEKSLELVKKDELSALIEELV